MTPPPRAPALQAVCGDECVEYPQRHDPEVAPVTDVLDLGLLSFGEDVDLSSAYRRGGLKLTGPTPAYGAHLSACTSSAATPKSPRDRMGLAP